MSDQPLPYGWIQEIDPTHNHPYYVDTKANPPRSIWVHPYEDEQYLSEHPDVREKVGKRHSTSGSDLKPPMDDNRRHSFGGEGSQRVGGISASSSNPVLDTQVQAKKRGVFGKLKDKAIGTKEEREAEKRQRAELERRRQQAYQEQLAALRQQQQQQQFAGGAYAGAPMYASPAGAPYQQGGFGTGRRGGGGGLGLPLLGGLAGGLLLGDLLGGDGFGGGDWGGDGGFGGGDFGGF